MNVRELIAELQNFDQEAEVRFEFPSHDYWKTVLAGEIRQADEVYVTWSEYHREFEIASDRDLDDPTADLKQVVILS